MRGYYFILAICLATAAALPKERIVGGLTVGITQYPYAAVLLYAQNHVNFVQNCGGTIINNRSILTAAQCSVGLGSPSQHRARLGSSFASSGGTVFNVDRFITHPSYGIGAFKNSDISIVRLTTAITFGANMRAGSIAGSNYNLPDNTIVSTVGWGYTSWLGAPSEQLRHVQIRVVNQERCLAIYGASVFNANMLCAGWDIDGRGPCVADSGGPLIHNDVAVGIVSFGVQCALASHPDVYTRISRFTNWIQSNA